MPHLASLIDMGFKLATGQVGDSFLRLQTYIVLVYSGLFLICLGSELSIMYLLTFLVAIYHCDCFTQNPSVV